MNGMRVRSTRSRMIRVKSVIGLMALSLVMIGGAGSAAAQTPPAISISPTTGPAGTVVHVSGSGFEGMCSVTISLDEPPNSIVLGGDTPDAAGAFEVDVTIPSTTSAGPHVIVAVGLVVGGEFCSTPTSNVGRAEFTVTPGEGELQPRFVPIKPEHTDITDGFSTTTAHLKFVQGSQVRLREGEFVSLGEDDLTGLQEVLAGFPEVVPSRLFSARSEAELSREKARLEGKSGREQGDKNLYFLLTYPESTDAEALIDALNALAIVEIAYPVALEGADPNHIDFRGDQGYREAAPGGVAADAAMTVPGGRGVNVQVIDIERFFNEDHEDLPTVTTFANGDVDAAFDPPYDHGTAVLGEVFGEDNGFGVLGIADQADPGFVTTAGGRPNAIDIAAANSVAGDVLLLELQRGGPNGTCSAGNQFGCVPEEFVQASYDAIVAAVADGIIVVAAAGNGSQDLDDDDYDATFGTRPDSGAIIVGAGGAPGCTAPARGRLNFSNFGSRVNLQGWGECVASTGYGDAGEGSPDSDDAYTDSFSGTSSATPIVAASAAVVSSVAIANGDADGLNSTEARQLLIDTGTPQDTGVTALAGHIGPLPNLADALGLEADLVVTKTDDPDPVAAGEDLTYTVTVTNDGPNVAIDATLIDTLPDDVTFVSTDGDCVLEPDNDLVCDLGDMADGASVVIEIVVAVPPDIVFDAGAPVNITNTATASSTIDDGDAASSTAVAGTAVVAVADLQVDSVSVLGVPAAALIGDPIPVTVRSTVRNLGPSWPIDAELETTGTPSAGGSVVPGSDTVAVGALALNTPRVVDQVFTISCTGPGQQEVVFDVEISPAHAADTDPNPANDTGQVTASVTCVVPIVINIHPGNQFNRVNVNSNAVILVAALTTEAGEYGLPVAFDATLIVPESVRFGDADAVWAGTGGAPNFNGLVNINDWHERDDKTKDGDLDMRLHFKTPATGIVSGATEACMSGEYVDGGMTFQFFGCDMVNTKP